MRLHRAAAIGITTVVLGLTVAPVQAANSTWTFRPGPVVLSAKTIGQPESELTGTPDGSAIRLPDGRIRMYFSIANGAEFSGVGSAISTDGRRFTAEPGERVSPWKDGGFTNGVGSPFIYRLPTGEYRLYYATNGGLGSSTSADGLTFTKDPGMRLPKGVFTDAVSQAALFCSAIVPLPNAAYRMYCTQGVKTVQINAATLNDRAVFSATSTDLLDWTPEPGVRLGPGSSNRFDADHPTVLVSTPAGGVTLAYDRRRGAPGEWKVFGEFMATSKDGLTFGKEIFTGIEGSEPTYVPINAKSGFLYYGKFSPERGSTISVGKAKRS